MGLLDNAGIEKKINRAIAQGTKPLKPKPQGYQFWFKGIALSLLVAGGIVALASRFSIAIATQDSLCLPPYRIWLIDKYDRVPVRGEIFSFASKGLEPVFSDGTNIVKIMTGMPGDKAEVTLQGAYINGEKVADGLGVADQLAISKDRYVRQGVISEDRYWFFGTTSDSFDSRYWGSVSGEQITGRAYPIW